MSRSDQYVGLNGWANSLVSQTEQVREVGTITHSDGRVEAFDRMVDVLTVEPEKYDEFEGAFYNEFDLLKYVLLDGTEYYEYVQASPWSSGPMYFIALKDKDGNLVKESLWTDRDIDEYVNGSVDEEEYDDEGNYLRNSAEDDPDFDPDNFDDNFNPKKEGEE